MKLSVFRASLGYMGTRPQKKHKPNFSNNKIYTTVCVILNVVLHFSIYHAVIYYLMLEKETRKFS